VGFVLLTLAGVLLIVGALVLVGRMYPGSGADLLDWQPTRSYEDEARLEEDVQQMIEAQNEYRRRRGAPEITQEDVERQAAEDEEVRQRHGRWS